MRFLNKAQIFINQVKSFAKKFISRFSLIEKIIVLGLLLVIIVAAAWRLSFYQEGSFIKPIKGGSIVEGVVGKFQIINPLYSQVNQVDADIVKLVFSGLVKSSRGREILPDLAESWSVVNNGKTYIFNLRKDIVWHDGEVFNSDDVVFTIKLIQDDNYLGVLKESWKDVEATALNLHTVQFNLPNPSTFFLSRATLGILPAHLFAHLPVVDIGKSEHNLKPIGTGPYKILQLLNSRDSVSLVLNNEYYDTTPFLDKIVFYFYDNEKSLAQALRNGSVTSAGFSVLNQSRDLNLPTINTYIYQFPQYKAVFFNQLGDNQALKDRAVRTALALSSNKAKIIRDVMDGNANPVDSPILPGFWGHLPDIKKYNFDFIEARDVLDKAGWKDTDSDGVLDKDNVKLSFNLSFTDDVINHQIASILISDWNAMGAQVYLDPVPAQNLLNDIIRPRNYDALIFGQNLGSDSDPYVYWHSSQTSDPGLALAVMYDKDIDNNLELARLTTSLNRSINYYHSFQRAFAISVPAILLYQPNFVYLVDAKVKGVTEEINLSSITDRFLNIADWYIRYNRFTDEIEDSGDEKQIENTDIAEEGTP